MDLSSQANTNYINSNGITNYGITSSPTNNSNVTQLNNNANIKSLLSSPIAGIGAGGLNQLRVVHQQQQQQQSPASNYHYHLQQNNKRSPTATYFNSASPSVMASSGFVMTSIPIPISSYSNNSNNNNNNYSSRNSSSQNDYIRNNIQNSGTSTTSPAMMISPAISSSSSTLSSLASPNSGIIGNGSNERVPCMLSDHDRLPHNAQILANRYLMLNQIAGSSFYECVDIRTGEALTCKAIGNCYSKILSAYFRMDGDPHIKPLHKLLQSSDQTYLLLPPSQYGDLHSYVRERKRLREPEARKLFRQICKTVKSCHQQGIVLRDLKLRKFVFSDCERTHLKFESLEDAVVLENPDDDILKEKIGCPAYVAPEILKPNSDFSGKAADLWSLGVILYTMLVGRYPFNDPEHSSLFAKIARCQFTIPEYLSSKSRCLIKSLLQKVPKHRLTSDDVLYHPWLQEDNNTTGNYNINNFNCNSTSTTMNNDLSNDDQRVPEIDCLELT